MFLEVREIFQMKYEVDENIWWQEEQHRVFVVEFSQINMEDKKWRM